MRRYVITLGAPTSSGGSVISAASNSKIDGAAIALEGDLVTCPMCKTAGKIQCVGPRIPETWNGRNVALENDLCLCLCATAPRLVARQTLRCQVIKDTGRALSNPGQVAAVRGASHHGYTERFRLVDEHDGSPLAQREYAVVRASGQLEFGTSDALGLTHALSSTAQAETVEIYAHGLVTAASLIAPSGAVLHHRARLDTTPAIESQPKEVPMQQSLHLVPMRAAEALASYPGEAVSRAAP